MLLLPNDLSQLSPVSHHALLPRGDKRTYNAFSPMNPLEIFRSLPKQPFCLDARVEV
ncbi:MAG: hypothetical protein ACI8XZ_004357 [Gammaproteobacteria bacterium]|jgi:hypothetical protein